MANDDENSFERLRVLFGKFCADQDHWRHYFKRSRAEAERLARLRYGASASSASTMTEAE